jgi:hypothetical protein
MKNSLFAILALLSALFNGRAATVTWTGGGNNDNWSTAANWGGIVPSPGDSLIFTTTSRLINTNNFRRARLLAALRSKSLPATSC